MPAQPSVFVCVSCGRVDVDGKSPCRGCDERGPYTRLPVSAALPVVGFTASGKSCYIATLFGELMHGAPEWEVSVGDGAFEQLTYAYRMVRRGEMLSATCPSDPEILRMRVRWQRSNLFDLLMWDLAGEQYRDYATGRKVPDRLEPLLLGARSLLFCVSWRQIKGDDSFGFDPQEDDALAARLFRRLIDRGGRFKQVVVLLVGSDVYGPTPEEAHPSMLHDYAARYRIFSGVLKNAGVRVDPVPLTNFGYGYTPDAPDDKPRLFAPPAHNVLEPLRLVLPDYLSWWKRLFWRPRGPAAARPVPAAPAPAPAPKPQAHGGVFISYRRAGGAEIARLVRRELEGRGWRVFLDVDDLGAGTFDDRLLTEITAADAVVVILSPGALDRSDADDWLKREVAHALRSNKRVVPLLLPGFTFPPDDRLHPDFHALGRLNGVEYNHRYFQAAMDKLVEFLPRS